MLAHCLYIIIWLFFFHSIPSFSFFASSVSYVLLLFFGVLLGISPRVLRIFFIIIVVPSYIGPYNIVSAHDFFGFNHFSECFLLLLFSKPFSFFPFQILPHVVCHNFLQTFQVLFSFFYCFSHFFKLIFTFHPFFFFLFFFVCFFYYPFQVLHLLLLAVCSLNSIDSTTLYFANAITNSECFYWRQLT